MMAGRVDWTKTCKCYTNNCNHCGDGTCSDPTCTVYKSGCEPGCKGCEKKCQDGKPCKCCTPRCGCKEDCYGDGKDGTCEGKTNCERCVARKCKTLGAGKCICYRCSCGTQCNGFLCACCYFCNPGKCKSNGTCDGFVIGKCGPEGCKGHGTFDDEGNPVYVTKCDCKPGAECSCLIGKKQRDPKCRCIRGEPQKDGNCLIKCDRCGKLCSQDSYIRLGTLVVVPLAIAVILLCVWHQYRDKLRRMFL